MVHNTQIRKRTTIANNESYIGDSLEVKIQRMVHNKEPLTEGAQLIYTERKDGIQAAYDIRTDRWEIATEAMDAVAKSKQAKRDERAKALESVKTDIDSGAKSIVTTETGGSN